ncbi:MAG TPA: hypothetical protein HA263_11415 [Methanoregulaceae archaeon]|nr:hypothetical protein [Methanoregulaceae archaeon]
MNGDISTEHRVATLNVHHILSRAAGENGPRSERRKNGRSESERSSKAVAGRSAKAK